MYGHFLSITLYIFMLMRSIRSNRLLSSAKKRSAQQNQSRTVLPSTIQLSNSLPKIRFNFLSQSTSKLTYSSTIKQKTSNLSTSRKDSNRQSLPTTPSYSPLFLSSLATYSHLLETFEPFEYIHKSYPSASTRLSLNSKTETEEPDFSTAVPLLKEIHSAFRVLKLDAEMQRKREKRQKEQDELDSDDSSDDLDEDLKENRLKKKKGTEQTQAEATEEAYQCVADMDAHIDSLRQTKNDLEHKCANLKTKLQELRLRRDGLRQAIREMEVYLKAEHEHRNAFFEIVASLRKRLDDEFPITQSFGKAEVNESAAHQDGNGEKETEGEGEDGKQEGEGGEEVGKATKEEAAISESLKSESEGNFSQGDKFNSDKVESSGGEAEKKQHEQEGRNAEQEGGGELILLQARLKYRHFVFLSFA